MNKIEITDQFRIKLNPINEINNKKKQKFYKQWWLSMIDDDKANWIHLDWLVDWLIGWMIIISIWHCIVYDKDSKKNRTQFINQSS